MWSTRSSSIAGGRGLRFSVTIASRAASYADVIHAWQNDTGFRSWFNAVLAGSPYSEFRWETPPVTSDSGSHPFEFVLLDSPGLARRPDTEAFAKYFGGTTDDVVAFPNLGRDAVLVVPRPLATPSSYVHLGAFVRHAHERQQDALWQAVGEAMANRMSDVPVWLSTAGAGVAWLHVRLDNAPKYYGFAEYKKRIPGLQL